MAFHQTRFPLDIALGARGGPERLTDIASLTSGHEERNSRWRHSKRRYNAGYGVKSRADMQKVVAFFEERRARFHAFLWRDTFDYSSNGGDGSPTAMDQVIGVGDGQQKQFQLIKRYGAFFDPYDRDISKPIKASVRVGVDGVEVSGATYEVDALTGLINLNAAPPSGQQITAGFLFDVPVRFDTDRLDIELSSFDGAEVPNIPLVEVRL